MFFEIILAIILGVCAGTFTGLVPGIHVNLVCAMLLAFAPLLLSVVGVLPVIVAIIAMSVTHTFIDAIPSIFLGAPDASMTLSALPGHQLLCEGRGIEAVRLTQVGSLAAVCVSVVCFPLFVLFIKHFDVTITPILLSTLVLFLLLQTTKKGVLIFFLAGILGFLVFRMPGLSQPLLALLTGLFGLSGLFLSMSQETIPKQRNESFCASFRMLIPGQLAGFLTAVLPGLGSAAAASLLMPFLKMTKEHFLFITGVIGTVNFSLSLVTWYVLDRARNGSIIALKELVTVDFQLIMYCLATLLFASGLASLFLIPLSRLATSLNKIPYTKMVRTIIVFLLVVVVVFSGWQGMVVLFVATSLGVLAQLLKVPRIYLMGCIILPVLSYVW